MKEDSDRPLAVVTGASSGIGLELARLCAERGYDLLVAADRPLREIVQIGREVGVRVEALQLDLARDEGIEQVVDAAQGRKVDILIANAGHGLGKGFLDQEMHEAQHVIDTNISGTLTLIHRIGNLMRGTGGGRILITGSIAGFMPGTYQAVYNGTKAFIDSFSWALRNELKDTGITVTCLMPGATDTEFFERAEMLDTAIGASSRKMDPAEVAKIGFEAMMNGEGDIVAGVKNKLRAAMANITPAGVLAEQHRRMAQPGSAKK